MAVRRGHCFRRTIAAHFIGITLLLSVALEAIADDSPTKPQAQRTGRSVDSAARQAGHDAKQAGKEVTDKAKNLGRDVAHAAKKAGTDIAGAADRVGSALKHAAKSGVAAVKQAGQSLKQDRGKQNPSNGNSDSKKTDSP